MDTTYQTDFALWAARQAKALRDVAQAGGNAPVDWEHVAEEIEDLGNSKRDALESQIGRILQHLMKLQASPATDPRRGWAATVIQARSECAKLLRRNPSLRVDLPAIVNEGVDDARKVVGAIIALYDEAPTRDLNDLSYGIEQVLGDWWP